MKSVFILIIVIIVAATSYCQEKLCSHSGQYLEDQINLDSKYSLELNISAYNYIKKILDVSNLPMNFVVQKVEQAKNAYAYMDSFGIRYILYDDKFLNTLNSDSTNTEFITVLAHEIGHHLAGHSLSIDNFIKLDSCTYWCNPNHPKYNKSKMSSHCSEYLKKRRNQETEADVFAGYIMAKLKANKSKVKNTFNQISNNSDDKYSTHPKLSKRLHSIDVGYKLASSGVNGHINLMQKIRIDSLNLTDQQLKLIKKKRLISKIRIHATHEALSIVDNRSRLQIGTSAFHGGPSLIDEKGYYLERFGANIRIPELNINEINNLFHLKVENEILYLIMVHDNNHKIIYTSIFNEEKISFTEITNLFAIIYEKLVAEELKKRR